MQEGEILIKDRKTKKLTEEENRGLICVSNLPHDFYEEQLKGYFLKFGKITNVKVCRSSRTGKSEGYGYVEFLHPEVAIIAAETMNNCIIFKRSLTVEHVPYEERPKCLFDGKSTTSTNVSVKLRREKQYQAQRQRTKKRLTRLNKKLKKPDNMETAPIDIGGIKKENKSGNENKALLPNSESTIEKSDRNPLTKNFGQLSGSKSLSKCINIPTDQLLCKSLDSVRAEISTNSVKIPKADKATLVNIKSKKRGLKNTNQNLKRKNTNFFNANILKRVAKELIRKRGESLLSFPLPSTRSKKKSKK